ncbi:MAG: class I tRNA ligase family protein [Candidatus Komeilibacteria bacterium]|nr:class I tRNA ligase family protein [Candidatus Komeilibacteria bacterium]
MKYYLTTPIYYVNDQPHIGHAYTTVVADVLARYHRQQGRDVFFLTGTDEHGAKIATSASKQGMEPQAFCDLNAAKFKVAWQALDISYDKFIRTTDEYHERAVIKIFQDLYDRGYLEEREYTGLYCVGCEKFLTDKELVDGLCPDHKQPPTSVKEKNWFFKLSEFLPRVRDLIASDEIKILPITRKNEVLGLIKTNSLGDFSVSRQKSSVSWGVELPFDKNQVSYVWVDALSNYITAVGYNQDEAEFNKWWPADLHLMAQDILKFHAVYWPALLLALDLPLFKTEFVHGFFTIDGQKMSKTVGNVIDPIALVEKYGADATRYLLLSQFPFGQEADIKAELFDERYTADLANGYGNAVARVTNLIEKNDITVRWEAADKEWREKIATYYTDLRFDLVIKEAVARIKALDVYINDTKPWQQTDSAELTSVLSHCANELKTISETLFPFMPAKAAAVLDCLNNDKIKKGPNLFPRLS